MQAGTDLHHLLLHSTSGPALDRVVNAGSAEGLRAWQLLVERYDQLVRSRTAGQPLSLLQFDFSGDMLANLEAYERDLALYEQKPQERRSQMACVWDCSEPSDGHRACDALVAEFREIPDVGPLSSRACGCLACKGSSVGSLEPMTRAQHRWR